MFNPNTSAAPVANNTRATGNFEKAIGFVNLYLPSKDGRRVKFGAIPLRKSNERENALVEALKANPDLAAVILSKLELDFQPVVEGDGNLFDLG